MHLDGDLYAVIFRELPVLGPVGDYLLFPLPVEHVKILRRPWASNPVRILRVVTIAGAAREVDHHRDPEFRGKLYSPSARVGVALGHRGIRVNRIPMTAQRADCETLIVQLLFEFRQFLFVLEHRELTMRISRIVSGAQLNGVDIQLFQLVEHFV
jgi:hypothetical protein